MSTQRSLHTATGLANGRVLIAGGYDKTMTTLSSAEIYDPLTRRFSTIKPMKYARVAASATRLKDGRVLMVGGQDAAGVGMASVEIYDPLTGSFTETGSMTIARLNPSVTLLDDGSVLVTGGNKGTSKSPALASAELYRPKTGTFEPTGSMTVARRNHPGTRLKNGNVLIVGGYNGEAVNAPEVYDPKTKLFTSVAAMSTPRRYPSATPLKNGDVLVIGGYAKAEGSPLASAETYKQSSNAGAGGFVAAGSLLTARGRHTASDLGKGKILIAGGWDGTTALASAELYDTLRGTSSATAPMTTPRWRHTETLLPNGSVLIAGGADANNALASAEIFTPALA